MGFSIALIIIVLIVLYSLARTAGESDRTMEQIREQSLLGRGFVGTGAKPVPLYEDEVRALLKQMGMEEARKNIDCAVGDTVELLTESFKGQVGQVSEIDAEKGKITVMVPFFGGRETPVEVEFDQVLKV